jgi:prepilin-type N-terminal cleavage/methylation domain-containing protein
MNWPSNTGRLTRRGFTLIEALVATAVLALLVGTALAGVSWTLGQSAVRTDRAWLIELARSVADEYQITRDPALAQGRAAPDLVWQLSAVERPHPPIPGTGLVEVAVSAWREDRADRLVTLQLLLPASRP